MLGHEDLLGLGRRDTGKGTVYLFSQIDKKTIFRQQNGKCAICHMKMDMNEAVYYRNTSWCDSGRKKVINARAVCDSCHKVLIHKDKQKNPEAARKQPDVA